MIPVVFIQVWKKCNVDIAISKASQINVVHLIGDRNYSHGDCQFHNVAQWKSNIEAWLDHQRQGKWNDFESLCMYRWVYIRLLMDKIGCDTVWACDSDVLVFRNALDEYERLDKPKMTFSYCPESRQRGDPSPLGHAGHSIVCANYLDQFIAKRHPEWNDMFAWTTMLLQAKMPVVDTAVIRGQTVWDHHMGNDLKNYDSFHDMKKVRFVNRMPTVRHKEHGDIETSVLHCWSPAELKMKQLSEGKNLE